MDKRQHLCADTGEHSEGLPAGWATDKDVGTSLLSAQGNEIHMLAQVHLKEMTQQFRST